jgi:predicted DNA-binding transcriptional regulator YafY
MSYVREAKILRLLTIARYLMGGGRTIEQLMQKFDISQRTAYRYLILFDEAGMTIDKDFEGKFFIASDKCPMCGMVHEIKELVHG